jgi:YfiH family protein
VPDPALPAPFNWDGEHIAAELPGARVLFSTRRGGVSEGPFASLNLGRLTADHGANVDANRERLAAAVGLPRERFLYGRQVHGATVRRATEPPGAARPAVEEDGQATALDDAAALVFVADCLPVMLVAGQTVAALHCGWRGLAAGICAEGVAALRELGANGPVTAAIGPSARGCCYEVGEDVHARFAGIPGARAEERNLDLPAIARHRLAEAGVTTVHDAGLCTMCWFGLFFSHRRDKGATGRQAGVVWPT